MNLALEDAHELAAALNLFTRSNERVHLESYSERREEARRALASVSAAKDRYSYESLLSGVNFATEQERIQQEEL